jgi:hypothetical protein
MNCQNIYIYYFEMKVDVEVEEREEGIFGSVSKPLAAFKAALLGGAAHRRFATPTSNPISAYKSIHA